MADNRKLAQGLMMMTPAMRDDLAGREQDIQRGKTVELLRRAGKEMYENPIVNTAIGFTPVLGDIQAGVEAYRSAQAGDWGNAGLNAAGMLPFIPMLGKTVWHGSPHTFDKFDMSKIGTGEGAQSYGHGLYLAEARPTAEEYAKTLSGETFKVGNEVFDPHSLQHLNVRTTAYGGDVDKALEKARSIAASDSPVANLAQQDLAVLENIKAQGGMMPNEGQLYKVDLPDEQIAKMLDWDKPLSEQAPEVQQAIAPFVEDIVKNSLHGEDYLLNGQWTRTRDIPANNLWGNLVNKHGPEKASQTLYEAGIPGIQYLDQASRNPSQRYIARSPQGGESTFNSAEEAQQFIQNMGKRGHEFEYVDPNLTKNYVVFSDEIPQILERNNQPVGMFK